MLKNYFKIAIAVLKRRKFFTFISLFGISFTLTILIVLTAFVDNVISPNYPEVNRDKSLYISVLQQKDLKHFGDRFYTVERWNDTLVLNVLRFGQMIGWQQPKAHFAFHYFLNEGYANDLVVQRGRFEGWNRSTLTFMFRRIQGSIKDFEERHDN